MSRWSQAQRTTRRWAVDLGLVHGADKADRIVLLAVECMLLLGISAVSPLTVGNSRTARSPGRCPAPR